MEHTYKARVTSNLSETCKNIKEFFTIPCICETLSTSDFHKSIKLLFDERHMISLQVSPSAD